MKYIHYEGERVLGIYDPELHATIPESNFPVIDEIWQAFLSDQSAYKVAMGTLIYAPYIPTQEEIDAEKLAAIRAERDRLLADSDKYVLADYPITPENLAIAKAYRQALRYFPETADLDNPQWPVLEFLPPPQESPTEPPAEEGV